MKEIKFKVWDNVNYMSQPFTLLDIQSKQIQFTSDCIVLQYTGLKDKNGKDVYEGDIVEMDAHPLHGISRIRRIIGFKNGSFRTMKSKSSSATHFNNIFSQKVYNINLTVIGNIYENPELKPVHVNNMKGRVMLHSEQNAQVSDTTDDEQRTKS